MIKGHPRFDWYTSQSEDEWLHAQELLENAPSPKARGGTLHKHGSTIGCIVLLLLLCGWMWYRDGLENNRRELESQNSLKQVAQRQRVREIERASDLIQMASLSGQGSFPLGAMTAQAWTDTQVDELYRHDHTALVRVTSHTSATGGEAVAYRTLHFYRQTEQGWEKIGPIPEMLGPWQTVETPHFIIRHRRFDAEAVTAVAHRLELLYGKLRRDLGLPLAAPAKITIELSYGPPENAYLLYFRQRMIQIPSPALLQIPLEWTDDVVLHGALVYPLARFATVERQEESPGAWTKRAWAWHSMLEALRLWELWESETPLALWKEGLITWLYIDDIPANDPWRVPDEYQEICRTYAVWHLIPSENKIPLTCMDLDPLDPSRARIPRRLRTMAPLQESYLAEEGLTIQSLIMEPTMGGTVGLATVIEYAVATHGIESLPVLIEALGHHDNWETLIPAVYGTTAAEFEAGWLAYMDMHYQ